MNGSTKYSICKEGDFLDEKYYRRSDVTGRTFNLFECVKILNIRQAIFYIQHGVPLMDLQIGTSEKYNTPLLIFLFRKRDTCEARELWNMAKG